MAAGRTTLKTDAAPIRLIGAVPTQIATMAA